MNQLSDRLNRLSQSATLLMSQKSNELKTLLSSSGLSGFAPGYRCQIKERKWFGLHSGTDFLL